MFQFLIVLTGGDVSIFVAKYFLSKSRNGFVSILNTEEVPEIEILAPSDSVQIPTYWQWKYQRKDKCLNEGKSLKCIKSRWKRCE